MLGREETEPWSTPVLALMLIIVLTPSNYGEDINQ